MDSIKAIFLFYLIYRIIFYSNFDLFCGLNIFNNKMRTGVNQEERVYNGYNFSYSSPEDSWFKRKIITTIENLTGNQSFSAYIMNCTITILTRTKFGRRSSIV